MTDELLGHLVPATVAAVEAFADTDGARPHPEEEPLIARAVERRRREFITARACARSALRRWVAEPGPVLAEARGAPIWPKGYVGSLTHCAGYRAAAVGRATEFASIGIDAEPHEALPSEVVGAVMSPAEQAALDRRTADHPDLHWDRMLFSAKESTYKAWYPLTGRWLDFLEAEVRFEDGARRSRLADGTFTSRLLVPGPIVGGVAVSAFEGRWRVDRGLVVAAIVVAAG
jgi:4'-phosphopantetheinyl transferase EntD